MTSAPEWVSIVAPFVSGVFGVGTTIGVFWGKISQKLADHDRRISSTEDKLERQVGEARCDKMREECRDTVDKLYQRR